jgi:hypothetical protein
MFKVNPIKVKRIWVFVNEKYDVKYALNLRLRYKSTSSMVLLIYSC